MLLTEYVLNSFFNMFSCSYFQSLNFPLTINSVRNNGKFFFYKTALEIQYLDDKDIAGVFVIINSFKARNYLAFMKI